MDCYCILNWVTAVKNFVFAIEVQSRVSLQGNEGYNLYQGESLLNGVSDDEVSHRSAESDSNIPHSTGSGSPYCTGHHFKQAQKTSG